MDLTKLRIGYVPYNQSFEKPGDKRRFIYYAKSRNIQFEIADPKKKYDVIVLSQVADLSIWPKYDLNGKTKIVYEAINSYLAVPKSEIKGSLRGLAKYFSGKSKRLRLDEWKAIKSMCSRADAVVCSTAEQMNDIKEFCSNVHIILDVHSTVSNRVKQNYKSGKVFNIVWEGMGDNAYQFLFLKNVLAELESRHEIALHLVTDLSYYKYLGKYGKKYTSNILKGLCKRVYLYDWNELMCSEIICASDLAVIPIDVSNPLVLGKPENKLLLFWRMGIPVVTSSTPAYDRAMSKAGIGMTCSNDKEWVSTIEKYIFSEKSRREAGLAGKRVVENEYSEDSTLRKWDSLFESLFN